MPLHAFWLAHKRLSAHLQAAAAPPGPPSRACCCCGGGCRGPRAAAAAHCAVMAVARTMAAAQPAPSLTGLASCCWRCRAAAGPLAAGRRAWQPSLHSDQRGSGGAASICHACEPMRRRASSLRACGHHTEGHPGMAGLSAAHAVHLGASRPTQACMHAEAAHAPHPQRSLSRQGAIASQQAMRRPPCTPSANQSPSTPSRCHLQQASPLRNRSCEPVTAQLPAGSRAA